MNESDIVKGCIKNNRESQKALYEQYFKKMLSICLRYSKDNNEAKDMLNEGFFNVFASIKNFKVNDSLESWIKKIMVNSAIEHLRKNKLNLIVSTVYSDKKALNPIAEISEEDLLLNIDKEEILKAVQQLTPAYRKVFNLYEIEEYSHKEIAGILDISEETSESNLSKAKFNLRKNIKQLIKGFDGK